MRPGLFRSCQGAVPRKNYRAENSHRTRRAARSVLAVVLFDGLRLALFDPILGLLSFAATRIFQSMLSGARPLDPVVLSGVISALSRFCPASLSHWGATRLDPRKRSESSKDRVCGDAESPGALPDAGQTIQRRIRFGRDACMQAWY